MQANNANTTKKETLTEDALVARGKDFKRALQEIKHPTTAPAQKVSGDDAIGTPHTKL